MNAQAVFDTLTYRIEVDEYGSRRYYNTNGLLHRTDGPAMELCDDTKIWMQNGQKHRTDGPAIIYSNRRKEWYINGKALSEDEFIQRVQSL